MSTKTDLKFNSELNFIIKNNDEVYLNIKKMVMDIYKMILSSFAENEFNTNQFNEFIKYTVLPEKNLSFCGYCSIDIKYPQKVYILKHKTENFMVVYIANQNDSIISKTYFYDREVIEDILETFESSIF